ncbi:MAG: hypothetical protein QM778_33535 [Myxococcales bacterium]
MALLIMVGSFLLGLTMAGLLWRGHRRRLELTTCPCLAYFEVAGSPAENPIEVAYSPPKLRALCPELFGHAPLPCHACGSVHLPHVLLKLVDQHLRLGDSRAAIVVSVEPLRIAAYSDEFDAVLEVSFPSGIGEGLTEGERLLTINAYGPHGDRPTEMAPDILPGAGASGRWWTFSPVIAELVSDSHTLIEERKQEIDEDEWERVAELVRYRHRTHHARSCNPLRAGDPAAPLPASELPSRSGLYQSSL